MFENDWRRASRACDDDWDGEDDGGARERCRTDERLEYGLYCIGVDVRGRGRRCAGTGE
jgi:hypothetical protein